MEKSIKVTLSFVSLLFQTKRSYNDNEVLEMKKLIPLIAAVVIIAGLPVLVVSDTSPIDSRIPNNEITTSQTEASNSSASATITITMYTVADE